jgi:acyl-CoA synthetase (AMP-forming)/AMP-acid ligase II
MLLRISLIVAILAGLGAAGLGYYEVSNQIPALTAQRDTENTAKKDALGKLSTSEKNLKVTKAELATTQGELADTKGERDKAVARAQAQSDRADKLSDQLAKAVEERDAAQNLLASYKATDLTPEQIITLNKQIKNANAQIAVINGEKGILARELAKKTAELERIVGNDPTVKLPAELKGKIVVVDPKWDFVVLNIGDDRGVLQDGELLVSRNGKLVAKVVVRSVQKDRCVANVIPGWKLGEMIEGDDVTPAHPAS